METRESTFTFTYLRREFVAKITRFTPVNREMIRVYLEMNFKGLPKEYVFIFYQDQRGELFWYEHESYMKQDMAKAIAKKLSVA